jgi:hypothetical protein
MRKLHEVNSDIQKIDERIDQAVEWFNETPDADIDVYYHPFFDGYATKNTYWDKFRKLLRKRAILYREYYHVERSNVKQGNLFSV